MGAADGQVVQAPVVVLAGGSMLAGVRAASAGLTVLGFSAPATGRSNVAMITATTWSARPRYRGGIVADPAFFVCFCVAHEAVVLRLFCAAHEVVVQIFALFERLI